MLSDGDVHSSESLVQRKELSMDRGQWCDKTWEVRATHRLDSDRRRIVVRDQFPRGRVEDKGDASALVKVSEEGSDSLSVRVENLRRNEAQREFVTESVNDTYTSADHLSVGAVTARASTSAGGRDSDLLLVKFRGVAGRSIGDGGGGESAASSGETDRVRGKTTAQSWRQKKGTTNWKKCTNMRILLAGNPRLVQMERARLMDVSAPQVERGAFGPDFALQLPVTS